MRRGGRHQCVWRLFPDRSEGAVFDADHESFAERVAIAVKCDRTLYPIELLAGENNFFQGLSRILGLALDGVENDIGGVETEGFGKARLPAEPALIGGAEIEVSGCPAIAVKKLRNRNAFDPFAPDFGEAFGGCSFRGSQPDFRIQQSDRVAYPGGIDRVGDNDDAFGVPGQGVFCEDVEIGFVAGKEGQRREQGAPGVGK